MPTIPLLGFMPDAPSTTPGVFTDCVNVVPTEDGFVSAPSAVTLPSFAALASPCTGAIVASLINGTRRVFAGTTTRLYEYQSTAWVDVSRVALYTGSAAVNRWSWAQLGNTTIAANDGAVLQASTSSGAFADIATAPQARVVISAANFVIALNTSDGTYGDQGDRWWCSGIFDHTVWTPSVATQANTGRLTAGGGDLVAGLPLGQQAVAYKARAMFLGSYVGTPTVWQWDQVPGEVGCVGPEAVCDVGGPHFFVGEDNIWLFDGTRPRPLADNTVRQWFYGSLSATYRERTIVSFERQNNRVWIFYPGTDSADGSPNRALVYHLLTNKWGRADRSIQAAMGFVTPGAAMDTWSDFGASYDALPDVPFDSQYWIAGGRALGVFGPDNRIVTLNGGGDNCSFTSGDFGDTWRSSMLRSVRLQHTEAPTTATISGQTRAYTDGPAATGGSGSMLDGKLDCRQSGRWHRVTVSMTGQTEFNGIDFDITASGNR